MNIDKITQIVVEMYNDVDLLTAKYGKNSKVVQKLNRQANAFAELCDEYRLVLHSNKLYEISYTASMMMRQKKKGQTYEDQARLNGWEYEQWKTLDSIEEKINYILKTTMKETQPRP